MNCEAFERRLERYQSGTLPEMERRESEQHLCQCSACGALLEALQSGEDRADSLDFSKAVLSLTSGPACGRCRNQLGDLLDGALAGDESELVMSHVAACPSCRSLFQLMSEMGQVLPDMRDVTPDPTFVADVLRSIRALRRAPPRISRILDFIAALVERPRFSWEAAYLVTLLVFGLFGTPFSPVHDTGSRLLASLQNSEGLLAQADGSVKVWREEAGIALRVSDSTKQTVIRMAARTAETAELAVGQVSSSLREAEEYLGFAQKAVRAGIMEVYQEATRSEAPPKH